MKIWQFNYCKKCCKIFCVHNIVLLSSDSSLLGPHTIFFPLIGIGLYPYFFLSLSLDMVKTLNSLISNYFYKLMIFSE